jgi:purine nucleoside phosphorylase
LYRGLGYLSQSPSFCPETRAALLNVIGNQNGIVVAAPERAITPAEVKAWGILGGKIAMPGLGPEWYLCRELELGYAPLCYVSWTPEESSSLTDDPVRSIIERIVAALPLEHSWMESNSAARRELGEDWHQWIVSS